MPSTPIALILFVWLTIPGLVYILQRRRMSQVRSESAFVESTRIVLVSMVSDLLAVGLLAVARLVLPNATPDLRHLLIDNWREQLSSHWALDIWWAIGLMAVACLLAYVTAKWGQQFAPFIVGSPQSRDWNKSRLRTSHLLGATPLRQTRSEQSQPQPPLAIDILLGFLWILAMARQVLWP